MTRRTAPIATARRIRLLALLSALLVASACGAPAPTTPPVPVGSFDTGFEFPPPQEVPEASSFDGPDLGSGGQGAGANLVVFDPWFVTDPMAENRTALTLLAPAGWQVNGSVVWLPEWRRLVHLQTQVSDPQTGITIDWLPLQNFIWFQPLEGLPPPPIGGNYQGKAYVPPPTDAAQFVADFWMPNSLAHLRNATLVRVDQVPAVADEFVRQYGGPASSVAFRMRYEYDNGGQLWEEDVFFAWLFTESGMPLLWFVNFAYSVRAPAGVIDANHGTISTIVASRDTTPEWEAVLRLTGELFTQRLQQQIANEAAFGQLLQQYRAETQALQQQVTAERQASQDRIAELRGEVLAGVETFVNPQAQQLVQLPAGQGNYWVNERGQYIASDQPGFDPVAAFGGFWTQLQPRQ